MAGAVLSGAIAAVDFDAAKAELRRAVEDFLTQLFAKAPDTDVATQLHAFPAWAADMTPVFLVTLAYRISLDIPSELKPIGFASLSPRRAGNRAELCRRLKRET